MMVYVFLKPPKLDQLHGLDGWMNEKCTHMRSFHLFLPIRFFLFFYFFKG